MEIISKALEEDNAFGDITTLSLVPKELSVSAKLIPKQDGVVCGLDIFAQTFHVLDRKVKFRMLKEDGERIRKGKTAGLLYGPARAILSGERTALNFIQYMSGIATLTNRYVSLVRGTKARIFDTRKTVPGLRALAKYAVVCGGGCNHRMNLGDMALIKDNHLKTTGDLTAAVRKIKMRSRSIKVEVECENLNQVSNALNARADIIMLDNMNIKKIREALKVIKEYTKKGNYKPETEISGRVNLATVREYAKTGVDRISVGALTHSAPAFDFNLEIVRT